MAAAIPLLGLALGGYAAYTAGKSVFGGKGGPAPQPPQPPTQDTASNAARAQDELMRRRRGVLANIYAGQQATAPPQTASKALLGS